jgi:hypothetical protein
MTVVTSKRFIVLRWTIGWVYSSEEGNEWGEIHAKAKGGSAA